MAHEVVVCGLQFLYSLFAHGLISLAFIVIQALNVDHSEFLWLNDDLRLRGIVIRSENTAWVDLFARSA